MSTVSASVAVWVMAAIIVLLLLVIWSMKRHRDPRLRIECDAPIDELMPSLAGLTLGTAVAGNAVEVFENGALFDPLLEHMRGARRSLHFETFLWKDGVLGRRVADVLCDRARAGVQVRVLLDANGTAGMGKAVERQLKAAGCKLVQFHDGRLRHIGVYNERDHRKLVVIDGRTAFLGGHCIVDTWLGDAEDHAHVADVSVKLTGPIVNSVQAAFSENWAGQTGELFVGDAVFPRLEPAGEVMVQAAYVKPEGSAPAVKILHHAVICLARRRLWIQNPYFIPRSDAIEAFGQAVARGVDVRILMPSTGGSDNPMVQHAGHWTFDRLLQHGVRIFEYPHTLLHQKVMTVDGVLCTVGSANFDVRSFEINDEITLGIHDPATVQRLEAIFEKYAARADEITLAQWRQRGLLPRVQEGLSYLIKEVL